jgi:DNA-binding CsgD family transcriptional regulator
MNEAPDARSAPAPSRDRSPEARTAAQAKKAERQTRIIGLLNRGLSMAEIAAGERVSVNRMRKVVRGALERRAPKGPAEYVALQVNRLNEALLIYFDSMYTSEFGANFKAIDSVVNIVREMDRYHGFSPASRRPERKTRSLPHAAARPLATRAAPTDSQETSQPIEKARFGVASG